MSEYDVVIIGGGAAGLSAAMVLARAQRSVLVVDAGHPRNAPATHLHGYLSRDGMSPADLLEAGRLEVRGYGGEIVEDAVTHAARCDSGSFHVALASGFRTTARRLLVATGLHDHLPDIEGLSERWARDVLHCPYCHGHEVRGQKLGVIGGTPGSARYAQIVRQWSDDVVYFAGTSTLTELERNQLEARAIDVVEGDVASIVVENDRLAGIRMHDGCTVPREAVFVPPTFVPNNGVLDDLGCEVDEQGWVVADATGQTSVTGVRVAGNVVNPRAQVITAAGEGSAAAIAMNADLVDDDVRRAVEAHADATRSHPPTQGEPTVPNPTGKPLGPPTKHQLALMIWLCVFPTLTAINLTLAGWLQPMSSVLRTFVLATIAVPIVIYGLMPQLHKARVRILSAQRK